MWRIAVFVAAGPGACRDSGVRERGEFEDTVVEDFDECG